MQRFSILKKVLVRNRNRNSHNKPICGNVQIIKVNFHHKGGVTVLSHTSQESDILEKNGFYKIK